MSDESSSESGTESSDSSPDETSGSGAEFNEVDSSDTESCDETDASQSHSSAENLEGIMDSDTLIETAEFNDDEEYQYQIISVEEALERNPDLKLGWEYDPRTRTFSNPKFAHIKHVVVVDKNGNVLWDQPKIDEEPGAVILPYDIKNGVVRVGLIFEERAIPGDKFYTVPRGLINKHENPIDAALRELQEETGITADPRKIVILGNNNANSTYFATKFPIIAVQVPTLDHLTKVPANDPKENIEWVKPFNYQQLISLASQGYLTDGITTSTLFHFGIYRPDFSASQQTHYLATKVAHRCYENAMPQLQKTILTNPHQPLNRETTLVLQ